MYKAPGGLGISTYFNELGSNRSEWVYFLDQSTLANEVPFQLTIECF